MLGVTTDTICNWEKNRGGPALRFSPKIIEFLGYDPFPQADSTLGKKLRQYRWKEGLSIKKLAKALGIDPTTLARWEGGKNLPSRRLRTRLCAFFDFE